ncbi:MAG TPA: Rrf2 family transcriptional regulator [Bacteroidetes bacterium]|nr:Rrf2 family transcriptional regulator [Bacteroidota bacterium]
MTFRYIVGDFEGIALDFFWFNIGLFRSDIMLQLSKKVEYGLIALRHMAMKPAGNIVTTKELAKQYDLPYELLAKILQKLARANVVRSLQGVKGGYTLAKKPEELKVASIIRIIEESKPMVAECYTEGPDGCSLFYNCTIRRPLGKLQRNLNVLFDQMTVREII